jgi:uncharacterized oxidoreductase
MPTFPASVLERATARAFVESGVPETAARIVAAHLVEAELCGVVSHGVIRVPQYVDAVEAGQIRVDAELTVLSERPGACVLDGGGGFGPVMAHGAMERAIAKARQNGVGAATLVHTGHTGRLASYALQAVDHGMAGVVLVNAGGNGQWVAPFGGRAGRLSTNPIAFAFPRGAAFPIVLDMATSVVPEGKVRAMKAGGGDLPSGWIVDSRGEPTTDPADLYGPPRGAILPAAGHKGYGLAFVVDLLAGALSGAGVCRREDAPLSAETDGVLLLALDIASFLALERFAAMADSLVAHVTSCPPAPGFDEVLVPGELEARRRREGLARGIAIDDGRWSVIAATFERLGVPVEPRGR